MMPPSSDVRNELRSSVPSLSYSWNGCHVVVAVGQPSTAAMARLLRLYCATDRRFTVLARALIYWAKVGLSYTGQRCGSHIVSKGGDLI